MKIRIRPVLLFCLFFKGVELGATELSAARPDKESLPAERRLKILSALDKDNSDSGRRALQELLYDWQESAGLTEAVFRLANKNNTTVDEDTLIEALRRCGKTGRKQFNAVLSSQRSDNESIFALVCVAIASMGSDGIPYVPELLASIADVRITQVNRGAALVALGMLGHNVKQTTHNVAEILAKEGFAREITLRALAHAKARPLATDEVVEEVVRVVATDVRAAPSGVLFLGQLGLRATRARPEVVRYKGWTMSEGHIRELGFFIAQASLARISAQEKTWITPALLRSFGGEEAAFNGHMQAILPEICALLVSDGEIDTVAGMLQSDDEEVVSGAAKFCYGLGLRAKRAETNLLGAFRKSKNEETRDSLAGAMGAVVSEASLPEVEALAKAERSERVKSTLRESIKVIQLEN